MSLEDVGENEFTTIDNKKLLWNILNDNGLFSNIKSDNDSDRMHEIFEKTMLEASNSNMTNGLLVNKNKYFIKNMVEQIQSMSSGNLGLDKSSINQNYRREDIHKKRKTDFEQRLAVRQKEFTDGNTVNVPKTPDFNEKLDEPLTDNMNSIISDMVKQRDLDMRRIENSQPKTEQGASLPEWINRDNTKSKQIKINDDINVPINTVIEVSEESISPKSTKKTISWADQVESMDEDDALHDFMQQLSMKPVIEPEYELNQEPELNQEHELKPLNMAEYGTDIKNDLLEIKQFLYKQDTHIENIIRLIRELCMKREDHVAAEDHVDDEELSPTFPI
jgi:hypothetical protein